MALFPSPFSTTLFWNSILHNLSVSFFFPSWWRAVLATQCSFIFHNVNLKQRWTALYSIHYKRMAFYADESNCQQHMTSIHGLCTSDIHNNSEKPICLFCSWLLSDTVMLWKIRKFSLLWKELFSINAQQILLQAQTSEGLKNKVTNESHL